MSDKIRAEMEAKYPILRPVRDYFEPTKEEQVQHLKEAMKGFPGHKE